MEAWTIAQWCREVGIDRKHFAEKVSAAGIKPCGDATGKASGAKLYRVRDFVKVSIGGDIEAERLRKTTEEADKLALANARSRGELVEVQSVKRLGERVMVAIRSRILQFPLSDDEKDTLLTELMDLGKMDWSREG